MIFIMDDNVHNVLTLTDAWSSSLRYTRVLFGIAVLTMPQQRNGSNDVEL